MRKVCIILPFVLIAGMLCACSSDENNDLTNGVTKDHEASYDSTIITSDSTITGTWVLDIISPLEGNDISIPSECKDLFIFNSNGKVKVIRNVNTYYCFLNEGEYEYSYDKVKQEIKIKGDTWVCIISDDKMSMRVLPNDIYVKSAIFTKIKSTIIGSWELETVLFTFGGNKGIPIGSRDLYLFTSDGKVKVIKHSTNSYFLNEGEYDYTFDEEKQEIMINGKLRKCTITDGKMTMSGDANAYSDTTIAYIFTKN